MDRRCRAPQHKSGAMYGVHTEESTESTMEYGVQRANCRKDEEGLLRLETLGKWEGNGYLLARQGTRSQVAVDNGSWAGV